MFTPWGKSDSTSVIAPGILEVTTPSHGGINLAPHLNSQVHKAWRQKSGWYEEDCEWAIVAVTFPAHFEGKTVQNGPHAGKTYVQYAHGVLKRWFPDQYGTVFGAPSYVLDGEIFWGQDRLDFLERALVAR